MGEWFTELKDRWDHDRRILPYIIAGLFDPNQEIAVIARDFVQKRGTQHSEEKEKEFRERLQLGYKEQWLLNGEVDEGALWFPLPFTERPDLGTRMLIRNYSRFWIKALFRDVKGLNMENQVKGLELLLANLIYCEGNIIQYFDKIIPSSIITVTKMYKRDKVIHERFF